MRSKKAGSGTVIALFTLASAGLQAGTPVRVTNTVAEERTLISTERFSEDEICLTVTTVKKGLLVERGQFGKMGQLPPGWDGKSAIKFNVVIHTGPGETAILGQPNPRSALIKFVLFDKNLNRVAGKDAKGYDVGLLSTLDKVVDEKGKEDLKTVWALGTEGKANMRFLGGFEAPDYPTEIKILH